MTTRVLALAATKGGVGKSTLATALAVQATKGNARVALLDWEPQGSVTLWWILRKRPDNPTVIRDVEDPVETVEKLRADGVDWVIVDTPPANLEQIERAIEAADFVLIPAQASIFDLHAVTSVAAACKDLQRPFAFVLNAEDARRKVLSTTAVTALKKIGPVLAEHVQDRTAYVSALNKGLTGPEHPDSRLAKEARAEIEALWAAVKKRVRT